MTEQEHQACEVCGDRLRFTWTDTHGIGACINCGLPYRIFHYDADKKRIDKGPEVALLPSGVEIAKRYWSERGRLVFPGCFDMGLLRGDRCTYSGATAEDIKAFGQWYEINYPEPETAEGRDR